MASRRPAISGASSSALRSPGPVFEPDLVLMYEPLGALTSSSANRCNMNHAHPRALGVTIVYVTHTSGSADHVERIAVFIRRGAALSTPDDL